MYTITYRNQTGVGQIELHAMSSRGTVRSNYNAVIENKPGQKASIRIYHALLKKHKSITPAAAKEVRQYQNPAEERNPSVHPISQTIKVYMKKLVMYDVMVSILSMMYANPSSIQGLEIYAEIAVEAKLKPGSHPNIDLLNVRT